MSEDIIRMLRQLFVHSLDKDAGIDCDVYEDMLEIAEVDESGTLSNVLERVECCESKYYLPEDCYAC